MSFITKHIYLAFSVLFFSVCNSQNIVPFTIRYQSNINGDMTVIANNITNRIDENNNANSPYVNKVNQLKNNEDFVMDYIDIDNDNTTFSSSSATLTLENQFDKKIIYAGLYWSATYKYERGTKSAKGKFIAQNSTRESFDKIKIKLPNQGNYLDITGQIIYDGIDNKKCKENAPYAMYADITNEVSKLSNPYGIYTVANIKATLGSLPNGVAAGWTIFFVYENPQMPYKHIVSMDGFSKLSKKHSKINFTGFESIAEGTVNASIAAAALGGNYNLKGDAIFYKKANKNNYVKFDNLLRNQDNIFNSSITINNDYIPNRNPNSNNTLGYDTFILAVPNSENSIIANKSNNLNLKLKSKKDNCYLFFTALSVDVKEPTNKLKPIQTETNGEIANENNTPIQNKAVSLTPVIPTFSATATNQNLAIKTTENQSENLNVVSENKLQKTQNTVTTNAEITPNKKVNTIKNAEEIASEQEYFNYDIAGVKQSYYIIVNVFAKESNRTNFVKLLRSKGFSASSFYNPTKKYYYVFIEESSDKAKIQALYNSKINNLYTNDMWILAVNKPTTSQNNYVSNFKISSNHKNQWGFCFNQKTESKIPFQNIKTESEIIKYFKKPDLMVYETVC